MVFVALMPSLGIFELIVLAALALVFLGPKKLPVFAKDFAKLLNQLRSIKEDFQRPLQENLKEDLKKTSSHQNLKDNE